MLVNVTKKLFFSVKENMMLVNQPSESERTKEVRKRGIEKEHSL